MFYLCRNNHDMKTASLFLFIFITSFVYSQNFVNTQSVESKILELNSKHRVSKGESERTICEVSKKAADLQLKYLVDNNLITHQSNIVLKGKTLNEPQQRFDYINKDSVKPVNSSGKIARKYYNGEVISYRTQSFVNDSTINDKIALSVYNGFCSSKFHNHIINSHNYFDGRKTTGYYSVKIVVLEENSKDITLQITCVGVMSLTLEE